MNSQTTPKTIRYDLTKIIKNSKPLYDGFTHYDFPEHYTYYCGKVEHYKEDGPITEIGGNIGATVGALAGAAGLMILTLSETEGSRVPAGAVFLAPIGFVAGGGIGWLVGRVCGSVMDFIMDPITPKHNADWSYHLVNYDYNREPEEVFREVIDTGRIVPPKISKTDIQFKARSFLRWLKYRKEFPRTITFSASDPEWEVYRLDRLVEEEKERLEGILTPIEELHFIPK